MVLRQVLRDGHHLEADQLVAALLEACDDIAHEAALDRVRLAPVHEGSLPLAGRSVDRVTCFVRQLLRT